MGFSAPVQYHNYTGLQIGCSLLMNHNFKCCADPVEPEPQPSQGQEPVHGHVCHCGRKAKSRSERFCVPTEKSRCPCVLKKIRCQAKCKCFNCDNYKRVNEKLSCRCGESTASNKQNPERKSCTDEPGQRRTRCPCYSNGRSCSNKCSCNKCGNDYGIKKPCSGTGAMTSRRKRMTTSPPSLKRKRTTTFLENGGFNAQQGPWALEETCLLDTVESFLSATCIIRSCRNITTLFNFVVNSRCALDLQLTAVEKTERQIQCKLEFAQKRKTALRNLYYGVSVLNN